MKLNKNKIQKLKYTEDPDYLIGAACATYYNDIFLRVLITDFDLFNKFSNQKLTKEQIVKKFKIKDRSACVFLPLLVKCGLLDIKDNKYFLTLNSKEFLLSTSEKYIGDFIVRGRYFYVIEKQLCDNISSILKTDKALFVYGGGEWITSMKKNKDFAKRFTRALDERGLYLAKEITKKLDLSKSKHLVDIGGSSGIYSCVLATYNPKLKIDILDIPTVVPETKELVNERGFSKQISVVSGDMFKHDYKQKYDVHFYSNVLHDWNIKDVIKLLKISYVGLPKDGKIIIHDGHKDLKNNPWSLLYNDISLLVETQGRYYYYYEIKEMLEKVGFKNIKKIDTVSGRSVVIGVK